MPERLNNVPQVIQQAVFASRKREVATISEALTRKPAVAPRPPLSPAIEWILHKAGIE